jgi:ribosomal protein L7/L12
MKLVLTQSEARALIRKQLNLENSVTEIEIVQDGGSISYDFDTRYAKVVELWNQPSGNGKIPAIKALRTQTQLGLFEAKSACENWVTFRDASIRLGRPAVASRDNRSGIITFS